MAEFLGAKEILTVSRNRKNGALSYEELYEEHRDVEIIIDTTPVGMYPEIYGKTLEFSRLPGVTGVIDAVYNPLRTPLILEAKQRGLTAEGGLYMLVAQAVKASEIFFDTTYKPEALTSVFNRIRKKKENIVLTGMPGSGKSTVGKLIAEKLGRPFIDTDRLAEEKAGCKIAELFQKKGEETFRKLESEVVKEVSKKTGSVIATGGGVPLRKENIRALKENGRIYFLDRPLSQLIPTADRPLANSREAVAKRFKERYETYLSACDVRIKADSTAQQVADQITGEFENETDLCN